MPAGYWPPQSPEKHHRAIADLLASCEQQRAYYAALCSTSHDHNRKLEMMQKVGCLWTTVNIKPDPDALAT